jgi:mono/diheme cytochrome c family protein
MRRILLIPLLAACGDAPPPAPSRPIPAAEAPAPPSVEVPVSYDPALAARGRSVHDAACAACHTLSSPPLTAPTLSEIVAQYHEAFEDPAEGIDHLADYIRQPSPATSRLPQAMIDEWGVMPPQAIAPDDRTAVAYFIWHLAEQPVGR